MALWAFHNNPGIGGFGENNPVIFDGSRTNTSERDDGLERKKQRGSSKCGIQIANGSSNHSKDHLNKKATAISFSEHLIGESDLICQIIKELVDNAVDACRSPVSECRHEMQKKRIRVDIVSTKSHPSKHHLHPYSPSQLQSQLRLLYLSLLLVMSFPLHTPSLLGFSNYHQL